MKSLKALLAKPYARRIQKKVSKWANNPLQTQEKVFQQLLKKAAHTEFGKDHDFENIHSHADFVARVPIRDYEALKPYVDRVVAGEADILWKGKPVYFAKTSGTTSGSKYIPITKESMPTHIEAARNAILLYIAETGNTDFVNGKMIFLQGSPVLKEENGVKLGRLSGIVAHYVPGYLQKNRMPSWETNCIDDWETKVEAIVDETLHEKMAIISGIPSWVLDSGIFYEFIKASEFFDENPTRITLKDVALGVNYVMIISTNAGLWAYNIGDTVEFTSLKPYKVLVSGRIKHFISAFGEHVIGKEVEHALNEALQQFGASINEFTVAPQITPTEGLPYHEWFIEFEKEPENIETFSKIMDASLQAQNSYYLDLIKGKILRTLQVTKIQKDGFQNYMKSIGKLGGQNKIPRLSNDRKIAKTLTNYKKV